jgi:uracil-DNA glycosylase
VALELDERQRAMLQEMGVPVWLPSAPVQPAISVPIPVPTSLPRSVPSTATLAQPAGRPALDLKALGWANLAQQAGQCQACGLCAGRTHATLTAPAASSPTDWFFVGDPPDEDEDKIGHAFAGQAGQLLDNMLKALHAQRHGDLTTAASKQAPGMARTHAYTTNIVKCRAPGSRLPQADELAQCAAYLQRELALAQPKVIIAMGRFAIAHMLAEHPEAQALPLGKQRGVVYHYQGIPVVVTYAPKVLLRASADKAKAWADLCLALDARDASQQSNVN